MIHDSHEPSPVDPCSTEARLPTSLISRATAFRHGAWRGARRGFIVGATYPVLLATLVWFIGALVFEPVLSCRRITADLGLLPLGACLYGLLGAAIGAMISGTIAARRYGRTQPPLARRNPLWIARGSHLFFIGLATLATANALAVAVVAWKCSQQQHRQKSEFVDTYRKKMEHEILGFCTEFGRMPNSAQELVRHSTILRTPDILDGMVQSGFDKPTLEQGWLTYERQVFAEVVSLHRQREGRGGHH